jgi:3-dehydrosphinganine reductase
MKDRQQHAIITGGSSGIGKATAKLLASQGWDISIIARDRDKLEVAKVEIAARQLHDRQQVLAVCADVEDKLQIEQAVKACTQQMPRVDLLITAAGIAHPGYFTELPLEVFERTMAVNYFGSLYCIKAVLPIMEQQQQGHIVLVSSVAGLIGVYGYTPYSPSKFAVRGLAESLRGELKVSGIDISIVYPPDTDTPQLEQENQTKPLETKKITATTKLWTAEAVAAEIVRGVQKKTFAIAPGLDIKILSKLHSLIAPAFNWYCDRIVSQVRKRGVRG